MRFPKNWLLLPIVLTLLILGALVAAYRVQNKSTNTIRLALSSDPLLSPLAQREKMRELFYPKLINHTTAGELKPGVAIDWKQQQLTTLYFIQEAGAIKALTTLQEKKKNWNRWKLVSIEIENRSLQLQFSQPGTRYVESVLRQIDVQQLEPVTEIVVRQKEAASATFWHFQETAVTVDQIVRFQLIDNREYRLLVVGDATHVTAELNNYYSANQSLQGNIHEFSPRNSLNEVTVKFSLDESALWPDRERITSRDVLATWMHYYQGVDETSQFWKAIQKIDTPDMDTLIVVYGHPIAAALYDWAIPIVPEKQIAQRSPHKPWLHRGNGPFQLKRHAAHRWLELQKNRPTQEKPTLIIGKIFTELWQHSLAFETAQVDVALSHRTKEQISENSMGISAPIHSYLSIAWNHRQPLLRDPSMRLALAELFPLREFLETVMPEKIVAPISIYQPGTPFFQPPSQPLAQDSYHAHTLLNSLGWKILPNGKFVREDKPLTLRLLVPLTDSTTIVTAQFVQEKFQEEGIEVILKLIDPKDLTAQRIDQTDYEGVIWREPYQPHPDQLELWHSTDTISGRGNLWAYRNDKLDELLEQIRSEYDLKRQKNLAHKIQDMIYEDQPRLFLTTLDTPHYFLRPELESERGALLTSQWGALRWLMEN